MERLVGSIHGDCLDHVIIVGERHLRTILKSYLEYYHRSRTPLALGKDSPEPRTDQPPKIEEIVEFHQVGVSTIAITDWRLDQVSQPYGLFQGSFSLGRFLSHSERIRCSDGFPMNLPRQI